MSVRRVVAAVSRWGADFLGGRVVRRLETISGNAEKVVRDVKVSLNVGVIVSAVALLIATVALAVAVRR